MSSLATARALRLWQRLHCSPMDLVIRGGTVVSAGTEAVTDIGVEDGRIVQLGGSMDAASTIDATGKVITPGGIDQHVHLTPPATGAAAWEWVDDFESGTRAALAGGVTTVGNISFPHRDETMAVAVQRDIEVANQLSLTDFIIHPVLMSPDTANLDEIQTLAEAGHTSVKIFLSFRRFDREVQAFLAAMRRIGQAGSLAMIHCEDSAIMGCCAEILREEGKTGHEFYPDTRPVVSEAIATARAVAFAEVTDCPIYVVHLAADKALRACREAKRGGLGVYVETRPLYLHLTRERFAGPEPGRYTGAPPLREQADVDAMWAGIRFGDVDTVCTDHAPWMLADKLDPAVEAADMRQGCADLETMLPMIWSAGVRTGRISLQRFVEVTSTNAAKLFGLYPRKGTISVGADADLIIWDPELTRVVDGAAMHSRSDFTPYDGTEVTGWPAYTISRGEIVAERDMVRAQPGRGRLVPRGRHQPL